jgi:membrane protein implicated in regulation of membrane protease activity
MKSGVFNLGFGLIAIAAGASGQFTLPGTTNAAWLMVAGGAVAAFGVFQLWRNRGR